jgi:hypothetical protein
MRDQTGVNSSFVGLELSEEVKEEKKVKIKLKLKMTENG